MTDPTDFIRAKEQRTGVVTKIIDGKPVEFYSEDHPEFERRCIQPSADARTQKCKHGISMLYGCTDCGRPV